MKRLSPNNILLLSLLVAILTIVLVEFVLEDIPELFSGAAKIGGILVNMSLSYIAAYFFYIVTFLIPRYIERKHIEEHAAHLINSVLFCIFFIIQDATNMKISQKDIKLKDMTEEDFKGTMNSIYMDDGLKNFRAGSDGHNMKVGEAVNNNIDALRNNVDELLKYAPYIEVQLIASLGAAIRNDMNESWKNSYLMRAVHMNGNTLVKKRTDVSSYAKYIYEYHQLYRTIEDILLKKYKSTVVAKKYAENIRSLQHG